MMDSPSTSELRARRIAGGAVLAGALIGLLLSLAGGDWARRTLFDAWQRAAPRAISSERVAVVQIDTLSLETVGPWPWPRVYLAQLTADIAAQRPKAIAFDMIFAEEDALSPANFAALYPEIDGALAARINALPTMDQAFAQAIGAAPVLLPRSGGVAGDSDPAQLMIDPAIAGTPPSGVPRDRYVLSSIPALDDVSLAHAMIDGPPDSDGVVRRVSLTVMAGDRAMPGMAVELARMASGVDRLAWQGGGLRLGDRTLPADSAGRMMFRMGELPPGSIHSAANVLAGRVASNAFAGKVVLVGLGAQGTVDIVATPLASEIFGVLVQAQAVDAILGGDWLARPPWVGWAEWGTALVLMLLLIAAGGQRRYALLWLALAVVAALWAGSFVAYDRGNLLLDPIRPTLIALSAASAMAVALFFLARAERTRLAAALVEQRVAAAEQEGELNAARRIQQGMVPGSEKLARLDPRVEIGAVLHPAKSVGGDFYDALMLDAQRLLFVIGDVTGKGVPAALYMALSKALSKSVLSRLREDLGSAVAALNRELMDEADEEMGVTALVGVLDCATGDVVLVSAGHEHPLVVRAGNAIDILQLRGGPPLCVVDFPYSEERAKLAPGETLVLITDGATEAQDGSRALLGLAGVMSALQGEGDMPATARAADLAQRIRSFEGETEPSDDLTIVALRWRGP